MISIAALPTLLARNVAAAVGALGDLAGDASPRLFYAINVSLQAANSEYQLSNRLVNRDRHARDLDRRGMIPCTATGLAALISIPGPIYKLELAACDAVFNAGGRP